MDTIIKEYGGILTAILCATVGFSIFALCIVFFGGNSKQMVSEMTGVQSATYAEGGDAGNNPISPTNCKHDYGAWAIEKQPTCTEQGIRFRICKDCGNKETGTVAKTKHDYSEEYTIDVEPTCINAGSKSQHCSICGAKRNVTTIEKLGEAGHNLEWAVDKSPTCVEEGLKSQYCSYCNARRNKTVIPIDLINGHKYGDFVVDTKPTCITTGVKSKYCSLCNNRTEITSIPNSGHVSAVSNYTCGTCGGSFSYNAYAKHTRAVYNSCEKSKSVYNGFVTCELCKGAGQLPYQQHCGIYEDTGNTYYNDKFNEYVKIWSCTGCGTTTWSFMGGRPGSHYITKYSTCPTCRGTGKREDWDVVTCSKCNGAGYYYTYPTCYGTMTAHHKCSVCSVKLD